MINNRWIHILHIVKIKGEGNVEMTGFLDDGSDSCFVRIAKAKEMGLKGKMGTSYIQVAGKDAEKKQLPRFTVPVLNDETGEIVYIRCLGLDTITTMSSGHVEVGEAYNLFQVP